MKLNREIISDLLDEFPKMRSVQNEMIYGEFFLWRLELKRKNYQELNSPNFSSIKPEKVKRYLAEGLPRRQNTGTTVPVLPGNWDLNATRIDNIHEPDTLNEELQNSSSVEGHKSGFAVAVSRDGDLLLADDLHAFLAARRSSQQIPVDIIARHSKWQELRKELYTRALEKHLYQPPTHPDCDLPSEDYRRAKDYCGQRFDMIADNLSARKGRLLDIGAAYGYFCHRFEEMGFDCYAVESDPTRLYYLKKLRKAENNEFKVLAQDILGWKGVGDLKFDVVLALNIFHHFLKRKKTYELLVKLLNKLQMKEMFFEPAISTEPQMKNSYKNFTEEQFVEFILKNSTLKSAKLIGTASDGRKIYKLF